MSEKLPFPAIQGFCQGADAGCGRTPQYLPENPSCDSYARSRTSISDTAGDTGEEVEVTVLQAHFDDVDGGRTSFLRPVPKVGQERLCIGHKIRGLV